MRSVAVNSLHRDSDYVALDERSSRSIVTTTISPDTDKIDLNRAKANSPLSQTNCTPIKPTPLQTRPLKRKRRRPSVAATASVNPPPVPYITSTGKVMKSKPGPKPKNQSQPVVAVKSAALSHKPVPKQHVPRKKKPLVVIEPKPKPVASPSTVQYHHSNPFFYAQTRGKTNSPLDIQATFFKKNLMTPEQEKTKYHNGFIHAPTFTPTEEEFKDPAAYISKITPVGKKFGILKVKPPSSWSVNYTLDSELFWFKPRRQTINSPNGSFQAKLNFISDLYYFHRKQGLLVVKLPFIDRRPLDIYHLHKCVNIRGGFLEVCRRKLWAQIGRELGYSGKVMTSLSTSLKSTYSKFLHPFDQFVETNGGYEKATQELRTDPEISILQKEFLPYVDTLTLFPGETIYNAYIKREGIDLDIHQEPETEVIKKLKALDPNVAILYNCNSDKHLTDVFSVSCSSTPIIRTREARLSSALPTAPDNDKQEERPWHYGLDKLSSSVHLYHESPTYNLRQFQIKAGLVYDEIFGVKTDKERKKISEELVEKEYWKLFDNKDRLLEVEFGADISTAIHGSGFPQIEDIHGPTKDSLHPWNLNVLPFCKGSMFNFIEEDVPYLYKPSIDIGMVFTTRSWQSSDFFTNTVSYNHFGDTKTYYSIPERHFQKFQNFIRMKLGDARVANFPDLLLEPNIMINPKILKENGIDCYVMDQRQGEFVITFPKSHICSFNHGFNMTEEVKFGLIEDWLDLGLECANLYMKYRIPPPFSIERLIITSAKNELKESQDPGITSRSRILTCLREICDTEINKREMLRQRFNLPEYWNSSNKNWTCSLTNATCFMSYIVDENSRVISIEGFLINPDKNCKLVLNLLDEELIKMAKMSPSKPLSQHKAKAYKKWLSRYEAFMSTTSRPNINKLNEFLDQGLCISGPEQPAVTTLREFMCDVNSLVKEINELLEYDPAPTSTIQLNQLPSLSYFQTLVDRALEIPVFFPELDKLMNRSQEIKKFTNKAEKVLEDQQCDSEQIEELLREGKKFNLNLPIFETLSQQLQDSLWELKLQKQPVMDLEELENKIKVARTRATPDDNKSLKQLLQMREESIKLDSQINKALTGENQMSFEQLKLIVEAATSQPVYRETSTFLLEMYYRYKTIEKEIAMLIKETEAPQLVNRPDFEYVNKIVQQIKNFNCKPTNMTVIENYSEKVTKWLQDGLTVFGIKSDQVTAVKQQLHAITKRNDACFKFNFESAGLLQKLGKANRDSYQPMCFCHWADLRSATVSCRVCHEKYHRKCLRLVKPLERDVLEIVCPLCRTKNNDPIGDFKIALPDPPRVHLESFEKWVRAGESLPLKSVEVLLGQRIVVKAHEFLVEAQRRIDDELASGGLYLDSVQTHTRITLLKNVLRRFVGSGIELDAVFETKLRTIIDQLDRGPSNTKTVKPSARLS